MTFSTKDSNYFSIRGIVFIFLFLFLIGPLASSLSHFGLLTLTPATFFISRLIYWLALGLLWLYAAKIEKQPILIWKEKSYTALQYIGSFFLIFLILIIGMIIINFLYSLTGLSKTSTALADTVGILRDHFLLAVFTALTAGIVEEVIFRGYIQPRLESILTNLSASIIISSLLFGLLHYKYGTVINVIGPFFIGLIFALYYSKYRNIKMIIICHFVWDMIAILTLMRMRH
ncbi:type II CAAX endopeptidase family protein [Ferruginibacter paludis]|uniref:CPBP family intramembrane glutamic endopeptidase n=1 Tax=Ferruginibacter paludis TaxID=1310417 RepID=UPI0025B5AFBA|nr:type II CAAX endopeptidase family protein [Ferruginibacter paludis]MDN3654173.1 type II CAAX endopeptidase family protein [Ferruginibacter paludis]